jgi:hypothetical protein
LLPPQRLLPRSGSPRCRRRVFRFANLSALPPCTHPFFDARRCHTARGLPPPTGLLGRIGVAARWRRSGAFCSDSVPEYRAPIRLLAPHRLELRSRLYPHLPPGGSRPGFAFPVARPFVCECRTIPAIPAPWTIPGLPELLDALPHRVARTHLGATGRNPNAFAPIVRARPFPVFGRPVHLPGLLPLITTRWFSSSLSDPASRRAPCPPEGRRWWLQVSLSVSRLSPSCLTSLSIPSIPSGR